MSDEKPTMPKPGLRSLWQYAPGCSLLCRGFYHKDRDEVVRWIARRSKDSDAVTLRGLGSGWLAIIQQEG